MQIMKTVAALTLVLLASSGVHAARDARPEGARGPEERQTLRHAGQERTYVVRIPQSLRHGQKVALVLVLHGGGGNAFITEKMTGFTSLAMKENFIVAYPEGTGRNPGQFLTWNAGHCCGMAMQQKTDDVGFINALISKLSGKYPIDAGRVYVTGMSNGGMMAHRLGIELPHRIAAIAPVVGTLFGDEKLPATWVSALTINGALDKSVPPHGGLGEGKGRKAWDGTPAKPAQYQGQFWARANQCHGEPLRKAQEGLVIWSYDCPAGRKVQSYLVLDAGHTWPGGRKGHPGADDPGNTLDATQTIWEFFKPLRRP